jgi:hypothetical protein
MARRYSAALRVALLTLTTAFPCALEAQTSDRATSSSRTTATVTVDLDPWLGPWARAQVQPSSAQSAQWRTARANLRLIDEALVPYRRNYVDLADDERGDIRRAFGDLIPGQRITTYRINAAQARAITYLALGPAERGRRGRRCEDTPIADPVPVPAAEPPRPSWCDAALDTLSRDAAWIHSTILVMGRTGAPRRPKSEELDVLKSMAERARQIVITTPRCGCALGDDAEALLTSTREAVDAFTGSSVPVWMTLRTEQVERIARLADSIERSLIHCLSSR